MQARSVGHHRIFSGPTRFVAGAPQFASDVPYSAGTFFATARVYMSWFRVSGGGLEYRGRITREPFTRWTQSDEAIPAITRVGSGLRFCLFGRNRAACRRLWRSLDTAVRTPSVAAAIAAEAPRFMQVVARLAYSDGL